MAMGNKHTNGPWKVSLTDDTVVVDANGAEVAAIDGDYNHPDTWPVMEANARLIAAAPDLLAALEAIMSERWYPAGRSEHVSDMARAAIAKARGEG